MLGKGRKKQGKTGTKEYIFRIGYEEADTGMGAKEQYKFAN